ncbi:MAG: acetyl-CoA carboxylase carboxyltransferase subunit alpha [Candidatus Marinimicrobia bacterium]|nr:acetyl-CoA carboxylase carboxyltransferase subunit alpha [Candidatus Neomarinimicrobiota bacterium]
MSRYILDFEAPLRELEEKIESLHSTATKTGVDVTSAIQQLEEELLIKKASIYENLSRWERVQLARHPKRPHSNDYIERIVDEWIELHGDRYFSDDTAIIGGIGKIGGQSFVIIGQEKGRGTKNKLYRNFGMPRPEGYRKALRLMKMAEKFNIPVLTIIDTIGAFPGLGAEERGQAEAIARNLFEMARLNVPIISIVIGEGASGGALGIGVADRLLCFENTWYSVISPEGCASILFRDATRAPEAADSMKVTAEDLFDLGIADKIIPEPDGGAHLNYDASADIMKNVVLEEYDALKTKTNEELINDRMVKYEKMGRWDELSE